MPGMRVSLTARFLSHPTIDFGPTRVRAPRARLGLDRPSVTYHGSRLTGRTQPTVESLRAATARFRFPTMGGSGRAVYRRTALPLGLQRARRA